MEFFSHIGFGAAGTAGLHSEAINSHITYPCRNTNCYSSPNADSTISYTCTTIPRATKTNPNSYTNSNGKTHADSNANITA